MALVALIAFAVVRPLIVVGLGPAYSLASERFVLLLPGAGFLSISKTTGIDLAGRRKLALGTYVAAIISVGARVAGKICGAP